MTIYPERIARALRESGEREEAKRREGIRNASRCAWCGGRLIPGERCTKRMCQLEEMGDSPSDYRRGRPQ